MYFDEGIDCCSQAVLRNVADLCIVELSKFAKYPGIEFITETASKAFGNAQAKIEVSELNFLNLWTQSRKTRGVFEVTCETTRHVLGTMKGLHVDPGLTHWAHQINELDRTSLTENIIDRKYDLTGLWLRSRDPRSTPSKSTAKAGELDAQSELDVRRDTHDGSTAVREQGGGDGSEECLALRQWVVEQMRERRAAHPDLGPGSGTEWLAHVRRCFRCSGPEWQGVDSLEAKVGALCQLWEEAAGGAPSAPPPSAGEAAVGGLKDEEVCAAVVGFASPAESEATSTRGWAEGFLSAPAAGDDPEAAATATDGVASTSLASVATAATAGETAGVAALGNRRSPSPCRADSLPSPPKPWACGDCREEPAPPLPAAAAASEEPAAVATAAASQGPIARTPPVIAELGDAGLVTMAVVIEIAVDQGAATAAANIDTAAAAIATTTITDSTTATGASDTSTTITNIAATTTVADTAAVVTTTTSTIDTDTPAAATDTTISDAADTAATTTLGAEEDDDDDDGGGWGVGDFVMLRPGAAAAHGAGGGPTVAHVVSAGVGRRGRWSDKTPV
jgi:hypothetical protein